MLTDVDHDGATRRRRGDGLDVHVRVIDVVFEGGVVVRVMMMRVVDRVVMRVIDIGARNSAPEDVRAGSDVLGGGVR